MQELAHRIAEAQIDLRRVRHARHQLLSQALSDPDYESEAMLGKKAALAIRCLRRIDPSTPMPENVMEFLSSKPEGPYKLATILTDRLVSYSRLTVMNGARCRDANLPFEPLVRRAAANDNLSYKVWSQ
jgi:hypothetical protein